MYGDMTDFLDPTECPACHEHERREIDIERRGVYLDYKYICVNCGNTWTVSEKIEK